MKNLLLKYLLSFLLVFSFMLSSSFAFEAGSSDSFQDLGSCDPLSLTNTLFLNSSPLFAEFAQSRYRPPYRPPSRPPSRPPYRPPYRPPAPPPPPCICDGCSRGSCTPPGCPCGSTTFTSWACHCATTSCSWTGSCSGCGCPPPPTGTNWRRCFHPHYNPAPSAPRDILITSPRSCVLTSATQRIYYDGSVSFRGRNATNNRAGDSLGMSPSLWYPSQSTNVSEGSTYTANPRAVSRNRCSGSTPGPRATGSFTVNNVPEVISIEPVEPHYNLGVSGRSDSKGPDKEFGCETDNPKGFEVVFRDKDGCGDIWSGRSADTNICGGTRTRNMSLRGVQEGTSSVVGSSSSPYDITCSGNQVTAYFDVTFTGDSVGNLDMQAKADDIVGNTSGWVQPSGGSPYWSYDGRPPTYQIESLYDNILDVRQFEVIWEVEDWTSGMSGVQAVRIFSTLEKGNILTDDSDYGPIIYEDDEFDVLGDEEEVWFEEVSKVEARENNDWGDTHLVDVGINQDGDLSFRIEAVDGACNYSDKLEELELGTPWMATRGGLVHSTGGFSLNVRSVVYNNPEIEMHKKLNLNLGDLVHNEETSISTELLTYELDGSELNTNLGWTNLFYRLAGYTKSPNINTGWYERLLTRAQIRDPGREMWEIKTGAEVTLSQGELNDNCRDSQYVYFIENDLIVNEKNTKFFENIGRDGVNGCIFVVGGNLTIDEGVYKSGGQ